MTTWISSRRGGGLQIPHKDFTLEGGSNNVVQVHKAKSHRGAKNYFVWFGWGENDFRISTMIAAREI